MSKRRDARLERALDLVGKVYEAAAEPALWPQFLEAFADATNCEGTIIWSHDTVDASARLNEPDTSFVSNVRFDAAFLRSYADYYTKRNVLLDGLHALPEGTLMVSSSMLPARDFEGTEYFNDWLRPQGTGSVMGGPVLKRGSKIAMFSTSRPAAAGRFTEGDERLMLLLMPHLRRGCLLHQRLVRLHAERAGASAALELLPTAVWLLDDTGKVMHANLAGRDLDSRRDGIWIDGDGRPVAAEPATRHALRRVIAATVAAGQGLGTDGACAVLVRRARSDTPLHVMLYPLAGQTLLPGGAAAMFIFDPARVTPPPAAILRSLYGLTPAESKLTEALALGLSVHEYCATHRLSDSTARTHLKRALAKTGTHRQSQLVGLVHRLSVATPRAAGR